MKTLVFSDTHFTKYFDKARYDFLVKTINDSDKVIINGDFWDSIVCSFDEFVASRWSGLFSLLKSKNAIYIYGNHDPESKCDNRVNLFSTKQSHSLRINLDEIELIIEHGDRIIGDFNTQYPWVKHRLDFIYKIFFNSYTSDNRLLKNIANKIMIWDKKIAQKEMLNIISAKNNNPSEISVFSHTHIQLDNKKNGFITIGAISIHKYEYAVIDDILGDIKLYSSNVSTKLK